MGQLLDYAAFAAAVVGQGLAPARGVDRDRGQQVAQLLGAVGIEGAVGATR